MAATTIQAVQDSSTKQLLERMVASRQLSSLDADALLRAKPNVASEEEILRWLATEYGLGYTTLEDVEPDRQLLSPFSRAHFAEGRIASAQARQRLRRSRDQPAFRHARF